MKVIIIDHTDEVLKELSGKIEVALMEAGDAAVSNVKILTPVGTPESTGISGYIGGTLRNSIDRVVDGNAVKIGTNVEYAKYVEYRDKPKHLVGQAHFLRDGIQNHINEYVDIIKSELTK